MSAAPFMVNYRVADLHALLDALRSEGVHVEEKVDESEYGKFGWVIEPRGQQSRAVATTRWAVNSRRWPHTLSHVLHDT
jgi:hypothetical protein